MPWKLISVRGMQHFRTGLSKAIILEAMDAGTQLMKDLGNYELRARIMWAASNALNGINWPAGRANGDFASHALATSCLSCTILRMLQASLFHFLPG